MRAALFAIPIVSACAVVDVAPPRAPLRPTLAKVQVAPAISGSYWEREPLDLHPSAIAAEPVSEERLVRLGGARARWDESAELRARVLQSGFALRLISAPHTQGDASLASFYRALEESGTPAVLTLDALFRAVRAVFVAALAEMDERLAPELETFVTKLDDRLAREQGGAKPDLAPAYARARGITAVARGLLQPKLAAPSDAIKAELDLVRAHVGVAMSAVLERPLDYSAFDVARGLADADPRLGRYRAALWLSVASLDLAARDPSALAPVARERTDTRAALIFARLLRGGEPDAARAWERIDELGSFAYGPSDDLTPRELAKIASNAGFDVRDEASVLNVVRVDRVRAAALASSSGALVDGVPIMDPHGKPVSTASVSLIGASAAPESVALAHLVAPYVAPDAKGKERTTPDPLDVGVYLGSQEAAALDKQIGAWELGPSFVEVAQRSIARDPDASHGTLHLSTLEALAAYLAPSAGDASALVLSTEWSRRKLDAALAAWATLRHDEAPFARAPASPPTRAALAPTTRSASSSSIPWTVEPHPEAIARLVALVKQMVRGLGARGLMKDGSPAHALAQRVSALLAAALAASVAEVNGEPLASQPLLEDLSGTFADIEAASGPLGAMIVSDVHTDLRSGRALEVGTRALDELWVVLRDPRGSQPTLFVGPHLGHASITATPRLNDRAWSAQARARPDWQKVVTSTSASP